MISLRHISVLFCLILTGQLFLSANNPEDALARKRPFAPVMVAWTDSLLGTLNTQQKIDLLFIQALPAISEVEQSISGLPSIVAARYDELWKIDSSGATLPEHQLSSIQDTQALQSYFDALAIWCNHQGINYLTGPSLSLFYNDLNPLTQIHTLDSEPEFPTLVGRLFTEAMQNHGILVAFDQFPGMGNTERGFESAPPLIFSNSDQLSQRDMAPFKAVINDGVKAIQIGHAIVPGVDSSMGEMASNSAAVMRKLLRDRLGFQGLVVAALERPDGKKKVLDPLQYIQRGGQLIITKDDPQPERDQLQLAVDVGALSIETLDAACKKVILARRWLTTKNPEVEPLDRRRKFSAVSRQSASASFALLRNTNDLVPFKRLDTLKIAYIKIGENAPNRFDLGRYSRGDVYHIGFTSMDEDYQEIAPQLPYYNLVILSVDGEENLPRKRFGLSGETASMIAQIAGRSSIALVWCGHHKALQYLGYYPNEPVVLLAHEPSPITDDLVLQTLFGGRPINGVLRRRVNDDFPRGTGFSTSKTRLAFGPAEELGYDSRAMERVNTLANAGIQEKAYPGCQVWVAKDGMVVWNKSYGHHTYKNKRAVQTDDLYDLASITKIAASTAGLMHLKDEGEFDLDQNLSTYLGDLVDSTDHGVLTFREILAHQAGLPAWIPFYTKTLAKGQPRFDIYSAAQSASYPIKVANDFYIRKDYPEVIMGQILSSKLSSEKKYKYSDIGYYFALRVIETQSGRTMEQYLDSTFYAPLGLSTMTYRPLERFEKSRIVPTEFDRAFRNQLIHGDVHDPGAAMMGGVGGHAGLFSNANDLGVMMTMFAQEGEYGYEHYLNPETLEDFIRCQFCDNDNRRGAGFDKPFMDGTEGPTCGCTDREAFGHQGFTGTTTWADAANGIVYVFLSNRVHPSANNRKLLEMNIRTEIQKTFYKEMAAGKE